VNGSSDRSAAKQRPRLPAREEQLQDVVEDYVRRLQAGDMSDPYELMVLHWSLARELEDRLQVIDLLYSNKASTTKRGGRPPGGSTPRHGVAPGTSCHLQVDAKPPLPTLGRYQLLERLGSGASAVVYRAWDPKLQREVALKVLRDEVVRDGDTTARFSREAPIVARLRHPNIVPLHEAGEADGRRYLDSELIVGETLERRMRRQPRLTLHESVQLVAKLAAALDYAHRQGIVHRDVKPSNVVIDEQGEPQLTDFGLARHEEAFETLTIEGQLVGTPAYMAPEQARGSGNVDGRSDVYSLGVILYELLTGRLPLPPQGSYAALVHRIIHEAPPQLRSIKPSIPRILETICLQALEKDPADRLESAAELAAELRRWLNDEPSRLRRPAPWESARRWARRNRLAAWFGSVALVLVLLATGVAYRQNLLRIVHRRAEAEAQIVALHDAVRQRLRKPTLNRREESLQLLDQVAKHRRWLAAGATADRVDLTTRSLWVSALSTVELVHDQLVDLPGAWDRPWPVAIHPDGRLMAIGTTRRPVFWNRGQALQMPPASENPQPGSRLAFSPGGRFLLLARDEGGLEVWDSALTQLVQRWTDEHEIPVLAFGFLNDETTAAVCFADGSVRCFSLPELEPMAAWPVGTSRPRWTAAAFNESGDRIALGGRHGELEVVDSDGKTLLAAIADSTQIESLAWSPDGGRVAVGTRSGVVRLWDVKAALPSRPFFVGPTGVGSILFTADGRWLIAGARNSATKIWNLTNEQHLASGSGPPSFRLSADDRFLAAAGINFVAFCELSTPEAIRQYSGHARSMQQIAWSNDSRRLATIDTGFQIHVWELGTSMPVYSAVARADEFYAHRSNAGLALSPDGRILAFASGGRTQSYLFMDDTVGGHRMWEGTLSGGYEHLAARDTRDFRLAREELSADGKTWCSAVYEWDAAGAPHGRRVLRQGAAGEAGFFDGELIRGGSQYVWSGPRRPPYQQHVEIWDIEERSAQRIKRSTSRLSDEANFCIAERAGLLFVTGGEGPSLFDLSTGGAGAPLRETAFVASPDGKWLLAQSDRDIHLCLQEGNGRQWRALIAFEGYDHAMGISAAFSPCGRYLAWGTDQGTLLIADLPRLRAQVSEIWKTNASE
jgi:WD40 repeat protein/tRNA A-37 threonylcarbamoyl transferase component Bud32